MRIKQLKAILEMAENENAEVFINSEPQDKSMEIDYNFDDIGDLDLYIVPFGAGRD